MLETRHQLLLGDNAFVERHWQTKNPEELREISKAHRRSVALLLDEYRMRHTNEDVREKNREQEMKMTV